MTAEDQRLIRAFEDCSLPLESWTQRTHVSIAYLYLLRHDFGETLELMRRGVKAFNSHHGVPESPTTGYNETTTVAFLRIIDATMKAYGSYLPTGSAEEFCDRHPQLMSKHILRLFYSPGRRMHPEAKARFVEPDMAPLPEFPGAGGSAG